MQDITLILVASTELTRLVIFMDLLRTPSIEEGMCCTSHCLDAAGVYSFPLVTGRILIECMNCPHENGPFMLKILGSTL